MDTTNGAKDGLCRQAALHMRAHHLLSLVCTLAGTDCPLLPRNQAERMIERPSALR